MEAKVGETLPCNVSALKIVGGKFYGLCIGPQ